MRAPMYLQERQWASFGMSLIRCEIISQEVIGFGREIWDIAVSHISHSIGWTSPTIDLIQRLLACWYRAFLTILF